MLSDSKIVIDKRPHDCDFMTAPIGAKHRSYQRECLVESYMLSPIGAHHPIEYGTMQEKQPPSCWQPDPACPEIDNPQPDEHPSFGWQARRVQIRWRNVED